MVYEFIVKCVWKFFFYQYMLKTAVIYGQNVAKNQLAEERVFDTIFRVKKLYSSNMID